MIARVPLAGIWNGGFWHADDLPDVEDGADLLTWIPREGSIVLTATAGATAPKNGADDYFGERCAVFSGGQHFRVDELAAILEDTSTPVAWVFNAALTGVSGTLLSAGLDAASPFCQHVHNSSKNPQVVRGASVPFACPTIEGGRGLFGVSIVGTTATLWHDTASQSGTITQVISGLDRAAIGALIRGNGIGGFTFSQFLAGNVRWFGFRHGAGAPLTLADMQALYEYSCGVPEPIWTVGDSMWVTGSGAASIRRGLWEHISKNNYRADFVGTQSLGTLWAHPKHNGASGTNLESHESTTLSVFGPGNAVPRAAIAMHWGGTNDMGAGPTAYDPELTPLKGRAVLDALAAQGADYIVAIHPPEIDPVAQPTAAANLLDYLPKFSAQCADFAADNPGITVIEIDTNAATGGYSAGKYADAFHLNDTGFADVLAVVLTAIDSKLASF